MTTATPEGPRVLSPAGVAAVCVGVGVVAAAATVVAAVREGSDALAQPGTLTVLTLLLVYTHLRPTRLMHRHGSVESDHLDEALLPPMILMLTSVEVAVAVLVASVAGNLAARRAPAVSPQVLQEWLRQGHDDHGRRVVMLDTRNQQEIAFGTFASALTLPITRFTELPAALAPHREALADATVVSFCTGGIRCEKAALWMQADGMDNVLQLDGGILGYFEAVGGEHYDGHCFVFDERVALDPLLRPLQDVAA